LALGLGKQQFRRLNETAAAQPSAVTQNDQNEYQEDNKANVPKATGKTVTFRFSH
jgi:hypothetical protein